MKVRDILENSDDWEDPKPTKDTWDKTPWDKKLEYFNQAHEHAKTIRHFLWNKLHRLLDTNTVVAKKNLPKNKRAGAIEIPAMFHGESAYFVLPGPNQQRQVREIQHYFKKYQQIDSEVDSWLKKRATATAQLNKQ